ncbi:MAG: hypothetical protein WCK37_01075 [Candidatus Falkowbacteria bacterium]
MKTEQKIWIIFLAHIYYRIEIKTKFYLDKGSLNFLEPIIKLWDQLGPKLITEWKNGERYINLENSGDYYTNLMRSSLLCLDYNSYTPYDIFIKVFGLDIQQLYSLAIYMHMAKLKYKIENGELFFFNESTNFHFKDGVIKPYSADHHDDVHKKRMEDGFDKDFLIFFEEHIGLDFSKAEDFFEVYLKSKIKE